LMVANLHAAAQVLKEASLRVPDVVGVPREITEKLPKPGEVKGYEQDVDDQVTGARCAASDKIIRLEQDARICPNCGQVFHKKGVPDACTHCKAELRGRTLRA